MALPDLIQASFARTQGYAAVVQALQDGKTPAAVFELCQGARSMLAALLAGNKRTLVLTATADRAQKLAQELCELGVPAAWLPARETSLYYTVAESRELIQRRIAVLGDYMQGRLHAIVAPIDAYLMPVMPLESFKKGVLSLNGGQVYPPEELIGSLVQMGYQRESMVESRGQFAMRGGILDVYPVQSLTALRVEFFDDEIDTIREMDVLTQRSVETIRVAEIYPATEAMADADTMRKAAVLLKKELEKALKDGEKLTRRAAKGAAASAAMPWLTKEDLQEDEAGGEITVNAQPGDKLRRAAERLFNAEAFDGMEGYLPYLYPENATLESHIRPQLVLLDEPGRVRERALDMAAGFERELLAAMERGEALKGQRALVQDWDAVLPRLVKLPLVLLGDLQVAVPDMKLKTLARIPTREVPDLKGQHNLLYDELNNLRAQKQAVLLCCGGEARGDRLTQSLREKGYDIRSIQKGESAEPGMLRLFACGFAHGFALPDAGLTVLGDADLFGAVRQKSSSRRKKTGQKLAAFTDLKVGDYVVHENHGVGIYTGTVRLEIQGHSRDYLHIQYGGSDALYVPTDQLDRVQKYIGVKDTPPRLNKLNGGEWEKAKQRVKASLMDMAQELIELYARRQAVKGYAFGHDNSMQRDFEDAFPYVETPDQLQCAKEIKQDMEKPQPMDRLLCGDVGYGKTEVALRAAFKAVLDSKQVAVLVPTTILAQQHYESMKRRFEGFPVKVEMLSRFRNPQAQKAILQKLEKGEIDVLIGTHRLLAKDVRFKDLGLLVVDEEQRFGVKHKESLKELKSMVDVLTLSATPIPRTLHMSMVGIRDMSLLETPPEERFPVQTYVLEYSDALLRDAIQRELTRKGQVYILYNRVRSIERFFDHVTRLVPEARVAVGHGQMREDALADVMLDFYEGRVDVLVCSTIIESGLDVQNANTMVVIDADRFGLSQLYQLRGRVGRSNRLGYCYLTVKPDKVVTEQAEKRLRAIREFTEFGSGFKIAMRDLEIRGAGNLLGAQQHGHMSEVGYDLYLKLMDETVHEIRGEEVNNAEIEAKVELRVDAFLPIEYVSGDMQRMDVYKRIAAIENREDWSDVLEEMIDRFGDVPPEAENLLWIALVKALCQRLGLDLCTIRDGRLFFRFSPLAAIDPTRLIAGLQSMNGKLILQNASVPALLLKDSGEPEEMLEKAASALEELIAGMTGESAQTSIHI